MGASHHTVPVLVRPSLVRIITVAPWRYMYQRGPAPTGSPGPTSSPHARDETRESRGMPCLFLNTERSFGGKPPKKSELNGRLRLLRSR